MSPSQSYDSVEKLFHSFGINKDIFEAAYKCMGRNTQAENTDW